MIGDDFDTGTWSYIDEKGQVIIESQFEDLEPFSSNGLAEAKIKMKFGYINENDQVVIEPKFSYAESFNENGLAKVKFEDGYYYINEKGEIIRPK